MLTNAFASSLFGFSPGITCVLRPAKRPMNRVRQIHSEKEKENEDRGFLCLDANHHQLPHPKASSSSPPISCSRDTTSHICLPQEWFTTLAPVGFLPASSRRFRGTILQEPGENWFLRVESCTVAFVADNGQQLEERRRKESG